MFKYSIVIPVFNSEMYLAECIESLITQQKSMEIILVDDGSTDNSGKICDEYAEKNSCVRVIHIENSGPGNARNIGAEAATGDLLMFVDSDDLVSENFFENFEKSNQDFDADVIFFDMVKLFDDGKKVSLAQGLKKDFLYKKCRVDAYDHIANCNKFPASPCGKIINTEFYKTSGVKMPCDVISEDVDWTLALVLAAKSFDFFEGGVYYYRQRQGSRSSFGSEKTVADALSIVEKWVCLMKKNEYKEYFLCFLAYQYAMIFPFVGALSFKKRRVYVEKMKKLSYLFKFGRTRKLKMINLLSKLAGINLASRILYLYVERRG